MRTIEKYCSNFVKKSLKAEFQLLRFSSKPHPAPGKANTSTKEQGEGNERF
jgi:hypothetical protein